MISPLDHLTCQNLVPNRLTYERSGELRTLFEAPQLKLWVSEVDATIQTHVREALDNLSLTLLWYAPVVPSHHKLP